MNPAIPILMTFFICIAFTIKAVVDARARSKLVAANRPDELIRSILLNDERQRRYSSLRWGVVLSCVAAGFALIQVFGWNEVTPGVIAVLLGATGVGNIVSYGITGKLASRHPHTREDAPG
jgi:hypothetical protein